MSSNVFKDFFIDFQRCIGCQACVSACAECHTHRGTSMITVDKVDPRKSNQTVPMVCMHCDLPTCALSCPADAIKKDDNDIVHSSLRARCVACKNCELSCPFGVPRVNDNLLLMQKCDMCYDRTAIGKKPMCATVCPSGALFYGSKEEIALLRPQSNPINKWMFGQQEIETRVFVMMPPDVKVMKVDWSENSINADDEDIVEQDDLDREFL